MIDYKSLATEARQKVLDMVYTAQSSHIGSNFSCIDILTVLFEQMNLKKDKFICSKGWVAASVYYFLAEKGLIPKEDLERFCREGETEYIGLIEPRGKFGLEFAGGSMGYGLPAGVGFALSKKMKMGLCTEEVCTCDGGCIKGHGNVYVLMSDGEMQCGTTWESAMIAGTRGLNNLVIFVDCNELQATGRVDKVLPIEPLVQKWLSFGWKVTEVDGHDFEQILTSLEEDFELDPGPVTRATSLQLQPLIVICHTIKGKGVSFMENQNLFHYKALSEEEYSLALKELNG